MQGIYGTLLEMKKTTLEQRFYEAIGIKQFRKIPRKLAKHSELLRYKYFLPDNPSIDYLKAFIKQCEFNARVHTGTGTLFAILIAINLLAQNPSIPAIAVPSLGLLYDAYSVMLQRHHCLRIKSIIEKKESKQVNEIPLLDLTK